MNGNTKIKFSLNIGVGNDVVDTFLVKEIVPNWKLITKADLREAIQAEFEEWKNERIDGAWKAIK